MALVVEDGSGVPDAESYASVALARSYATAHGYTLPTDDAEVEVLLRKAAQYLEGLREEYQGSRASAEQGLEWPRTGVYLYGFEFPDSDIPGPLARAQCQLAVEALTTDLQPNSVGPQVLRRKVDVIETQFADIGQAAPRPVFRKVDGLLKPLMRNYGPAPLRAVRA